MRKRSTAIADDEVLVCVESHWSGAHEFHREGERARRSAIDGFSQPYWGRDGSTLAELARLKQELAGEPAVEAPPEPVQLAVCVKAFTATNDQMQGVGPQLEGTIQVLQTGQLIMSVGDRLPASHPVVARYPNHFEVED